MAVVKFVFCLRLLFNYLPVLKFMMPHLNLQASCKLSVNPFFFIDYWKRRPSWVTSLCSKEWHMVTWLSHGKTSDLELHMVILDYLTSECTLSQHCYFRLDKGCGSHGFCLWGWNVWEAQKMNFEPFCLLTGPYRFMFYLSLIQDKWCQWCAAS